MRFRLRLVLVAAAAGTTPGDAQNPIRHPTEAVDARFARSQPVVHYTLRIDPADLSTFTVTLRIRHAPDTFTVAMAAHPEYDDRFWRHVEDVRIDAPSGPATIVRVDSALWHVRAPGGAGTISYRIRLPPPESPPRAAWRPFLDSTGALVGGPHSFMYITSATLAPSHLSLDLPPGWDVATGLASTSDPRTWFAPSIDVLVEAPILAGRLSSWHFAVDGVPHRVVYWRAPGAVPFDTIQFVGGIRRLVEQGVALFGRAPWREYTFMYRDAAWGGLEHANSVTLGVSSAELARNVDAHLPETAHEFFHAWNLMRIRPAEYQSVTWRAQPPTSGLWFSEGLTIFYADLLLRRAGLPVEDSTRVAHLASIIEAYLANVGYARLSAERVSKAAYNSSPEALGDYTASAHLQGEVLGTLLDLVVRDATNGQRSMDDVMRLMLERFAGERGFLGRDIERTVEDVCGCDVTPLFNAHVRAGTPIDFDRYLRLIGLRTRVTWTPALNREGQPAIDLRVWAYQREEDRSLRLRIGSPESVWGRAGLHTGDRLVAVNGTAVRTWPEFRAVLLKARLGDSVRIGVSRPAGPFTATVPVVGFDRPVVRIEADGKSSRKAEALREAWMAGR